MKYLVLIIMMFFYSAIFAQQDKKEVREGNKAYSSGDYSKAELDYMRALENNPYSFKAKYNLANTLHKRGNNKKAKELAVGLPDSASTREHSSMVFHNLGNYSLDEKNYSEAIEFYKNSLRLNPDDLETKSNLAYAQKMLENQQQNQDNQQNKDQQEDQDQEDQEDQDKQDKNNQNKDSDEQNKPEIDPRTAQQMLEAIQNKEKETQEKVKREKARAMEKRKKEKNW
jgi:tetratricopeptide (TPR) repeat protein